MTTPPCRPTQRPASTSDARKRHAEAQAAFEANRRDRCACGTHELADGEPVVTDGLLHDQVCISAEAVGL